MFLAVVRNCTKVAWCVRACWEQLVHVSDMTPARRISISQPCIAANLSDVACAVAACHAMIAASYTCAAYHHGKGRCMQRTFYVAVPALFASACCIGMPFATFHNTTMLAAALSGAAAACCVLPPAVVVC